MKPHLDKFCKSVKSCTAKAVTAVKTSANKLGKLIVSHKVATIAISATAVLAAVVVPVAVVLSTVQPAAMTTEKFLSLINPQALSSFTANQEMSVNASATIDGQEETIDGKFSFDVSANLKKADLDGKITLTGASMIQLMFPEAQNRNEIELANIYMRNGHLFAAAYPQSDLYEYSGNIFAAMGEMNWQDINEQLSQYASYIQDFADILGMTGCNGTAESLTVAGAKYGMNTYFNLMQTADALSITENSISTDLVKFFSTLSDDLKTVVDSVNKNTTFLDLLKNQHVKKYVEAITGSVSATKLHDKLPALLRDLNNRFVGNTEEGVHFLTVLSLLGIQPDAGSTAYEYFLKIIDSNAMDALMHGNNPFKGKVFDQFTEDFSWESFKNTLTEVVKTENGALSLYIPAEEMICVNLSEAKITWTVDEQSGAPGASLAVACNLSVPTEDGIVDVTATASSEIRLSAAEKVLIDVTDYAVKGELTYVFPDGESDRSFEYYDYSQDVYYTIIPIISDNEVVDFSVLKDGKTIESTYTPRNSYFSLRFSSISLYVEFSYVYMNETRYEIDVWLSGRNYWNCFPIYADEVCSDNTTIGAMIGK